MPLARWRTARSTWSTTRAGPMSWVGVGIVIVGFIIGGIAFFPAPHWTIFWIGTAVAIVGCLSLLFTKTMNEDWY